MRLKKLERCEKRQRGQFMTPPGLAYDIVKTLDLKGVRRILEPSCGNGSFVGAVLDRYQGEAGAMPGAPRDPNCIKVVGVEIDSELLVQCRLRAAAALEGIDHCSIDLLQGDFFRSFLERKIKMASEGPADPLAEKFDLIIGNPPFGGSFSPEIEDELDALLGNRGGFKIKKETYAFFIVACTELLNPGGRLLFICSDSLLTIPTMTGLRQFLMESGQVTLHKLDEFSTETNYPMLVLEYVHRATGDVVDRFGEQLQAADIKATPNLSWGVTPETAKMFCGPKLGDFFVASSGMTTGKNEYFVRQILPDNTIDEPFQFRFYDAPKSVAYEFERARLNKLPPKKVRELEKAEQRGDTERRIAIELRDSPMSVSLPNDDYRPYNKAIGRIVYCPPTHAIFWKDDGDAVLTYKRTGNWYLRGVGGQPFFGREGLTWQLVASRFVPRYLPPGYILDSGAPCGFTRDGVERSEIFFIVGWLLSPLAKQILKTVINHTMNIQSKDFERMPYPWWVNEATKKLATNYVVQILDEAMAGRQWNWTDSEITNLADLYRFVDPAVDSHGSNRPLSSQRRVDASSKNRCFDVNHLVGQ